MGFFKYSWPGLFGLVVCCLYAEEGELLNETVAQESIDAGQEEHKSVFDLSKLKESYKTYFTGEFLFWHFSEKGLGYAIKSKENSSKSRFRLPHFDWETGFRIGDGYRLPWVGKWDLYMNTTNYDTDASNRESPSDNEADSETLQTPYSSPDNSYINDAKSRLKMHVNMVTTELGRYMMVSKWLNVRPHIGMAGVIIKQKYPLEYKEGSGVPVNKKDDYNVRNNFWGVGVRMGAKSLWGLGRGFAIFGDGAFALTSGTYHIHETQDLPVSETDELTVKNNFDHMMAVGNLALGLQWDRLFSSTNFHLGIKLGYEFNMFTDQSQYLFFSNNTSPGSFFTNGEDLTIHGATLGFRFDF